MALPSTIDSTAPAGTDSPASGDDELRALKLWLVDVLGVPDGSSITAQAMDIQADGTKRLATRMEWGKGSDIASASSITIPTDGNYFDVTGTTDITALSSVQAGAIITLQFDGILEVTHNATSLILAHGVNYTTAAGRTLTLVSLGSGNWKEIGRNPPMLVSSEVIAHDTTGEAVAYTGIGFRPTTIIAFAAIDSAEGAAWGVAHSPSISHGIHHETDAADFDNIDASHFIDIRDSGGTARAIVALTSFDSDGFTLTYSNMAAAIDIVYWVIG